MKWTAVTCLWLACASIQLAYVRANISAENVQKVTGYLTDKVNETPQVEHKGGAKQQIMHKVVDSGSKIVIKKAAGMLLAQAAKYPLVAAAGPAAVPLAAAVASSVLVNEVHKRINKMSEPKEAGGVSEQTTEVTPESSSEQPSGLKRLLSKVTRSDSASGKIEDSEKVASTDKNEDKANVEAKGKTGAEVEETSGPNSEEKLNTKTGN